ncbi:hypothetical protein D0Z07_6225 [Hyphodiscus hymeniophilus]|uniref:Uncharacterized protein n=1 Tax=Hyphodiscus hymeniophilus TaxID=353542 RepID=A0A9P6VF87_9HELO|nr:hypothetical protein D0Z07_6225 [Hyphodiscus hymeniophilus]
MEGKVIALTGGASGIGLATAKLLSTRGATVCLADIDPHALEAAESHFSVLEVPYKITKVDVTKRAEVEAWLDSVIAQYGHLDGAANCAGIIGKKHGITTLIELEDEEWDRIISVNLTGMMNSLRAELKRIVDHGSIVNISSIQGVMGFAGSAAYVASKHGVIGLTRSAAKEVGDRNIRVNAIAPGSILTPLLRRAQEATPEEGFNTPTAFKRPGTAEEMAGIIAFLLGPESTYVTGSVYGGDGGWNC